MRLAPIILTITVFGCSPIPQGGGPSPRQILVVSTDSYSIEKVVESIDNAALGLDSVIDKSKATLRIGDSEHPRFPQYEYAFWYPYKGSEMYGVALVKWIAENGDTANKYFIDVYSEAKECNLCAGVKRAFDDAQISYYSACEEKPRKTEYESIRCDT